MTLIQKICASAPTRICDNGGWTDTWFAEYGKIFNIAVEPRVYVELKTHELGGYRPEIVINAKNFGDIYAPIGVFQKKWSTSPRSWGKHPLLEATIAEVGMPKDTAIEVIIWSDAPYGASTGTSAAVCVALAGALDALTPGRMTSYEIAQAAWRVETQQLGQQSGIQDQIGAAFGGINLIDMHAYPDATVEQLAVSDVILQELEQRLMLIYLGQPHSSSAVHEKVIREMEDIGPKAKPIEALRHTAEVSWHSLQQGDFLGLGKAMCQNTAGQRMLHSDLISPAAEKIIQIGQQYGVLGHKVNGAGGDGGSVTLLTNGDPQAKIELAQVITYTNPNWKIIPIKLASEGVIVSQ
ncbi:MAG: GHMP kinase [Chloroflexota bacterium]